MPICFLLIWLWYCLPQGQQTVSYVTVMWTWSAVDSQFCKTARDQITIAIIVICRSRQLWPLRSLWLIDAKPLFRIPLQGTNADDQTYTWKWKHVLGGRGNNMFAEIISQMKTTATDDNPTIDWRGKSTTYRRVELIHRWRPKWFRPGRLDNAQCVGRRSIIVRLRSPSGQHRRRHQPGRQVECAVSAGVSTPRGQTWESDAWFAPPSIHAHMLLQLLK